MLWHSTLDVLINYMSLLLDFPQLKYGTLPLLFVLFFKNWRKFWNRTNVLCLLLDFRNILLEVSVSPVTDANSLPYCFSIDVAFCMRTDSVSVCLTSSPPRSEGEIPSCNPSQVETERGGDILVLVRSFGEEWIPFFGFIFLSSAPSRVRAATPTMTEQCLIEAGGQVFSVFTTKTSFMTLGKS